MDSGLYRFQGLDAARHLFRVASGLDSMVLGETEITGQVKAAYECARTSGLTGKRLNRMFQKAQETAKEIRTRTGIGRGATSVGSVAVQQARKIFGPALSDKNVMIVGAGKMAATCLRHLAKSGVSSIAVVNRSLERALELAQPVGGRALSFMNCFEAMVEADLVITSTGCPHLIVYRSDVEGLMARRAGRPLIFIDIAVPRDVDPETRTIPGVHLYDIDDLEDAIRENVSHRRQDLSLCQEIIGVKAAELELGLSAEQRGEVVLSTTPFSKQEICSGVEPVFSPPAQSR
ncbi:MAG: glutamyl-tRNA reductase [Lentisphaerae bacterium GWF2_57_35]|nr:MAG: glutamyl-tRNA reductase [Lentisphaerae bacterium GWF2_57_35]